MLLSPYINRCLVEIAGQKRPWFHRASSPSRFDDRAALPSDAPDKPERRPKTSRATTASA